MNEIPFGSHSAHWVIACAAALTAWSPSASAQTTYTTTWASVDSHTGAPEWFQDAKFGIYYHWGAVSVPAFGSEWYPRNMYNKSGNSSEYQHQMSVYGDPFSNWPYDYFLSGANDKSGNFAQFAPKLVSAGGKWDPDAWAKIFADAGAWFAGPVAEHHDGFSMWDSQVNEWNSVKLGPKLDLAKLHGDAIRKLGLKFLMSSHNAYNFTGFYQWAPTQTDASLKKLYGQLANADEQTLWLNKLKEIIDKYLPDVIWQDFNLGQLSEANRLNFLAYYYNAGAAKNVQVVATAKDGIADSAGSHKGQVYDYERGGPGDITTPYWLTDDSVSSSSWCYTNGMGYYSSAQMVGSFIDRVSKGGNLLLNIAPMWDGTIPTQQQTILTALGTFLKQMGTAIYNTRTWVVYGEGPTKMGGGSFTAPTALTSSDIRYTKSKDGDAVYAILGGWPGNGKVVNMTAVTTARFDVSAGKVYLFGPVGGAAIQLTFTQDTSGLHVTLPSTQPYTNIAYAIKISKSGTLPVSTPCVNNTPCGTGGTGGTGGASSTGGATSAGGTSAAGGAKTTGGTTSAGGAKATGGSITAGGAVATGGVAAMGSSTATGGTSIISSAGGTTAVTAPTGGRIATGGAANNATGGLVAATGGSLGIGGGNPAGGQPATGGKNAVGGALATATGGQVGTAAATTSAAGETSVTNTGDTSNAGGCGCRVAGDRTNSKSLALLGALGLLMLRPRRRSKR